MQNKGSYFFLILIVSSCVTSLHKTNVTGENDGIVVVDECTMDTLRNFKYLNLPYSEKYNQDVFTQNFEKVVSHNTKSPIKLVDSSITGNRYLYLMFNNKFTPLGYPLRIILEPNVNDSTILIKEYAQVSVIVSKECQIKDSVINLEIWVGENPEYIQLDTIARARTFKHLLPPFRDSQNIKIYEVNSNFKNLIYQTSLINNCNRQQNIWMYSSDKIELEDLIK